MDKLTQISNFRGGLRLDAPPSKLKGNFLTDASNVEILDNAISCRRGCTTLGTGLPFDDPVRGIVQWRSLNEDFHVVAITDADIQELQTDNSWESILGEATWVCTNDTPVKYIVANDVLIITNGNNQMLYWDGSSETVSEVDGSSTYVVQDMVPFYSRVLYGLKTESGSNVPYRVRWTKTGTYDDFATGYAGYADLVDTPGGIEAIELLGSSAVIYKSDAIMRAVWIGGQSVFSFPTMVIGKGPVSPRAIVKFEESHVFLTYDNLYRYSGGYDVEPVGDAIHSEMPGYSSTETITRSFGIRFGDEAWFFVPMSEETPDRVYVFNNKTGEFTKHELSAVSACTYFKEDNILIGDLPGTIGSLGGVIGDYGSISVRPNMLLGTSAGYVLRTTNEVLTDNGSAIENYFCTKDFPNAEFGLTKYNRFRYVEFEAKGDSVTVYYSVDSGKSWYLIGEQELSQDYELYRLWFDTHARSVRFKFINDTAGEIFSITSLEIAYKEGSKR